MMIVYYDNSIAYKSMPDLIHSPFPLHPFKRKKKIEQINYFIKIYSYFLNVYILVILLLALIQISNRLTQNIFL